MSKTSKPRRGSLQYSPRVRAKRIYPTLRSFLRTESLLGGFAAYKVGMLQIKMVGNKKGSVLYGKDIVVPATILEAPDLFAVGVVSYESTPYGLRALDSYVESNASIKKYLERKIKISKEKKKSLDDIKKPEEGILRLIVATQPWKAGVGKKTPEIFEVPLVSNIDEAFTYAKEKIGKEIPVSEVFKPGMFVDVIGVTKGKGFEGSVKRFGVKIQKRGKSDKSIRRVGNLGPWHPAKTSWRVPQHGQHGYHRRTELNKYILDVGEAKEDVNPKSGWMHYGIIKSNYIILKGSIMGPPKRLVMLRPSVRPPSGKYDDPQIEDYLI
ncbi:MAG: 50S ribosomal protein L3 [Candidatus Nanohaloarchaeota archaeon]|nr:50S ribosomal protein L3 [Candidatus Nanohaloarchaeota archaeon]